MLSDSSRIITDNYMKTSLVENNARFNNLCQGSQHLIVYQVNEMIEKPMLIFSILEYLLNSVKYLCASKTLLCIILLLTFR